MFAGAGRGRSPRREAQRLAWVKPNRLRDYDDAAGGRAAGLAPDDAAVDPAHKDVTTGMPMRNVCQPAPPLPAPHDDGATAIEYALIAAGIAVAIIITVNALGVVGDERCGRRFPTRSASVLNRLRLFSRRYFLCAERIGKPLRRRARLERLLLALVRRPARQPDDLEGRAQAAVRHRRNVRA